MKYYLLLAVCGGALSLTAHQKLQSFRIKPDLHPSKLPRYRLAQLKLHNPQRSVILNTSSSTTSPRYDKDCDCNRCFAMSELERHMNKHINAGTTQ